MAIDASPASGRVATFVNEFFRGVDVEITAMNVGPTPVASAAAPIAPGALYAWHVGPPLPLAATEEDVDVLTDAGGRIIERSGLDDDSRVVDLGDPVELITRAAQERGVDLIVVGSNHKGVLERILSGSVSRELVQRSPVPVLVVQ